MPARQRPCGGMLGSPAVEADAAGGRREAAGDQVEQRGLARAVRPDDADRLARRDHEIEIVGDDDRAEAFLQACDFAA